MFTAVLDFIDSNIKIIEHEYMGLNDLDELLFYDTGYNLSQNNTQWMTLENMQIYLYSENTSISIPELIRAFHLGQKVANLKIEIKERLEEYSKAYIPENIESLSILEYGENEFFGGKKEVYEDILEYMERNGI